MSDTPNLKLPYIMPSQAQKHVTHNEAIRALDALVQIAVVSAGFSSPPADPLDGDRFIVAPAATGDWAGHDGKIAAWQDGAWAFYVPSEGWLAWVAETDRLVAWDGASWSDAFPSQVPQLGINGLADAANRLAVSSAATLLSHEGSGHQLKINKNLPADTASLLYQTGFSGRAEMGLAGDDDFQLKVSPDGASWLEAIVIDRNTGEVTLPNLRTAGTQTAVTVVPANPLLTLPLKVSNPDGAAAGFEVSAGSGAGLRRAEFTVDTAGNLVFRQTTSTGQMYFDFNGTINFRDKGAGYSNRLQINAGNVGIGVTGVTGAKLAVDGPVRLKSYAVAALPSASAAGAGAIIYVSDASGGPTLACSDGSDWRIVAALGAVVA
jgi:hypothetical protein